MQRTCVTILAIFVALVLQRVYHFCDTIFSIEVTTFRGTNATEQNTTTRSQYTSAGNETLEVNSDKSGHNKPVKTDMVRTKDPTTASGATLSNTDILPLASNLVQSPHTIVTAYFRIKSKHSSAEYKDWIKNMLSLQDPMVIFISASLIPEIQPLRKHALNRTVIIPMELEELPMATDYNTSFWQWQLEIDGEKGIHQSYQVFWIWLSKSWWVNQAIQHNFFNSELFVWTDMGCFRDGGYNYQKMVLHPELVPKQSMLFLAHSTINPPPTPIFNDKFGPNEKHFYTSGSMMAGYADTFQQFHLHFMDTVRQFLDHKMFIGEDQFVMQSTCLLHPDLCTYVPSAQVRDDNYFGLRYILHHGGKYTQTLQYNQ